MLNKGPVHQPDKSKVPAMKSRTSMIKGNNHVEHKAYF